MSKIFFIADTHFDHANIIKYCNRPFKSVEEMNNVMIENWNKKVNPEDSVYILGDFAFKNKDSAIKILNKLKGNKFLIKGNHDHIVKDKDFERKFAWVKDYYVLRHNNLKIVLFHYPMLSWDSKFHGSIHVYGHVHNGEEAKDYNIKNAYNAGVDINNFEPISLEELLIKLDYRIEDYITKK